MGAGFLGFFCLKRLLSRAPLGIGRVLDPVLRLLPAVLVGPALGAGVMYAVDQQDARAPGRKLADMSRRVTQDTRQALR